MLTPWITVSEHEEIDVVEVSASPDEAYALCRHLDLASVPLVGFLFELHTLPDCLAGREHEPLVHDDTARTGKPGFRIIEDKPGVGYVVGAIGKVWKPEIPFLEIAPQDFAAFSEPGWARIAWSLCFIPIEFGTRIEMTLRFACTDNDARLKLKNYYRLIRPFSHFIRRHLLSHITQILGLVDHNENLLALPGDEVIPLARFQVTHAITIKASPEQIWPWLVQMGYHRAGWYSYDALDNGGEPSAEVILPEFQTLKLGDALPVTPISEGCFTVLKLEPEHLLVLGSGLDLDIDLDADNNQPFNGALVASFLRDTWSFVLNPLSSDETRLIVRIRADYEPESVGLRSVWLMPLHHLMETHQLRNIKRRAEEQAVAVLH